jgi:ferredoxin
METIKRKPLVEWLEKTAHTKSLVAPKKVQGILLYQPVASSKEIVWDYIRPVLSAKDAFFPATEILLNIEKHQQKIKISEANPAKEQVLFGIRPCDARGIYAMDKAFIETEPVDDAYARRRERSIIISVACTEMDETCFCTRIGYGMDDSLGSDILLKPAADGYEVHLITPKGREFGYKEWGISSAEPETKVQELHPQPVLANLISQESLAAHFDDAYWQEVGQRCLSCRICAYVCPTCRCFDIRDETVSTGDGTDCFERVRCWDSCMGESYRKIAGGHNPRPEKGQRIRNRIYCKLSYFSEQYDAPACTGCGRCIDSCPVNIDITEIMAHFQWI